MSILPENHRHPSPPSAGAQTLQVENAALRKGFTLLPNTVLRARGLSRDAKLLYGILLSYAWQTESCFPGYDTLMDDMQCARAALAKYIRELRDAGLIAVQRRGQGKTSIYTIKDAVGSPVQKFDNRTSRSSESEQPVVWKANGEEYTEEENSDEKSSNIRNVAQERREEHTDKKEIATARTRSKGIEPVGAILQRRTLAISQPDREARQAVESAIREFGREFGDRASARSSTTRALNLMRQASLSLPAFISTLYEARAVTRDRAASGVATKTPMGYFFSVLTDLLGLKDQPIDGSDRADAMARQG